jgi:hypothetical protein
MLNHISWQQYFTAVLILTIGWYAYVALKFKLLKFSSATPPSVVPAVAGPVIGQILPDEGEAQAPEELSFGSSTPDSISDSTVPKGPADDFIAEAQTLADVAETKLEFLSLLEILVMKYEPDELNFDSLFNQIILPFTVAPDEWPQTQKA